MNERADSEPVAVTVQFAGFRPLAQFKAIDLNLVVQRGSRDDARVLGKDARRLGRLGPLKSTEDEIDVKLVVAEHAIAIDIQGIEIHKLGCGRQGEVKNIHKTRVISKIRMCLLDVDRDDARRAAGLRMGHRNERKLTVGIVLVIVGHRARVGPVVENRVPPVRCCRRQRAVGQTHQNDKQVPGRREIAPRPFSGDEVSSYGGLGAGFAGRLL